MISMYKYRVTLPSANVIHYDVKQVTHTESLMYVSMYVYRLRGHLNHVQTDHHAVYV